MKKILNGVRILDFTDALAGPFCTRYLADCGCEVITIERPGGKNSRSIPPFKNGQSMEFLYNHCGKKSIGIDLKNEASYDLIMKLAAISDVVIENFRPGIMTDYRLTYEDFKNVNPAIIMCSISGWGQTGPYAEYMGADLSIQAHSGILDLTGEADGPPCMVGFPVTDFLAGLNAFGAICAALYKRVVTGEGEYIDISMRDCAFVTLHTPLGVHTLDMKGINNRYAAGRFNPNMSPWGIYKGKDGYIAISAQTEIGWNRLTEIMGRPELANDARFNSREKRITNNNEVVKVIEEWLQIYDKVTDVANLLQSYRIQSIPVLSVAQIVDSDPQIKEREIIKEIHHKTLGKTKFFNSPLKFKNTAAFVEEPPPATPGEHTDYVLKDILKFNDATIEELKRKKIVFST